MPTMDWTYTDGISGIRSPVDYQTFGEIKTNVNAINTAIAPLVELAVTGGTSGTTATIADQGTTDYIVVVNFITDTPGNIGEWSIQVISATQFTLYNTGLSGISFTFKVLK